MLDRAALVFLAGLALLTGCPESDIGSPCNHGPAFVPQDKTITFPSLACDHLLCVFAESVEPPADPCTQASDCDAPGQEGRMDCVSGRCEVAASYVLDRSMCSQSCEVDADCGQSDPDSTCRSGFTCARLMGLGDHCCEKLCVCRDDLDVAAAQELEAQCSADALVGCCDQDPHPDACGR